VSHHENRQRPPVDRRVHVRPPRRGAGTRPQARAHAADTAAAAALLAAMASWPRISAAN
jgi:hypothetical protein